MSSPASAIDIHVRQELHRRLVEGFETSLNVQAVPQEGVGVPGAVNMAIRRLDGDVALFVDDAMPPRPWAGRYVEALGALDEEYAGVSSRDVLFEPGGALVRAPRREALGLAP